MLYFGELLHDCFHPDEPFLSDAKASRSGRIAQLYKFGVSEDVYKQAIANVCRKLDPGAQRKSDTNLNSLKVFPRAAEFTSVKTLHELTSLKTLHALVEAKEPQFLSDTAGPLARLLGRYGYNKIAMLVSDIDQGVQSAGLRSMTCTAAAGLVATGIVALAAHGSLQAPTAWVFKIGLGLMMAHGVLETSRDVLNEGRGNRLKLAAVRLSGAGSYQRLLNTYT